MREGLFIRKNKERWEKLEEKTPVDPDEMAGEFTRLVDDLAYAKSFYPTSRVTKYINSLASRIYLGIYQNRKEESNRLVRFWTFDVPYTIGKHYRIMLFACGIFALFFIFGFFLSTREPAIFDEIVGQPGYVAMSENNIKAGNPFGVYQDENEFAMFIGIMSNNVQVAFMYFSRGILIGVPSLYSLIFTSLMVGSFEEIFHRHGLGLAWVLAVLIHGLLELSAIIVACAAGMIMGTGYLFPGTGRRWTAFVQGVKDGAKLIISLVPVFIVAAFFESYVTRYYQKMSIVLNIIILLFAAFFVIWYYIVYPIILHQRVKAGFLKNV